MFIEFYPNTNYSLDVQNLLTSDAVAALSFGFLLAAAVPIFAAISNARAGLLSIFFPTCFAALPRCLKKLPNPSAAIV